MHPTLKNVFKVTITHIAFNKTYFFQHILLRRTDKFPLPYLLDQLFSTNSNLKVIKGKNIKLKAILSFRRPGRKLRSTVEMIRIVDSFKILDIIKIMEIIPGSCCLAQDPCMRYFQTYMHHSLFVLKEFKKIEWNLIAKLLIVRITFQPST